MKAFQSILFLCLLVSNNLSGQYSIDSVQFFKDDSVWNVTLATDMGKLMRERMKGEYMKASFTYTQADNTQITEEIRINARGRFRRQYCYLPPMRLSFKNTTSPKLSPLKSLKFVGGCRGGEYYEQLLLKEYLIYKIYNLLTDKSFRVRLLRVTYQDINGKKKAFSKYGFLVEDLNALAKRNNCKEWKKGKIGTESTDRSQMTIVALFQYMIGNTDWDVPNNHNIRLIYSKIDSNARPYAVPYDFDYAGLVNAEYAIPSQELSIENVAERLYRGFPRTMSELQAVLEVCNQQKERIYTLIRNFEPMSLRNKNQMTYYLDAFYKIINDPVQVKYIFIDNARRQ